jgi:hypothetical protein
MKQRSVSFWCTKKATTAKDRIPSVALLFIDFGIMLGSTVADLNQGIKR